MLLMALSSSRGAQSRVVSGLAQRVPTAVSAAAGTVAPRPPPAPRAAPIPLARWVTMRFHGTAAGEPPAVPAAEARAPQPAVLVKAGDAGHYSLVKLPDVMDMDRMALLEALAGTKGFSPKLAGVALDDCTVRVCASASKKAPSAAEAAAMNELEGAETLGDLAATAPLGANLFVRVTLPPVGAAVARFALSPAHPMVTLARAIVAAPEPTPKSPHIILAGGAKWPILESPVLFVRHFYDAFYTGVLGGARNGYTRDGVTYRSVCVTGNPGIGKSSFGYYALFRALREGRTVVYQAEKLLVSSAQQRFMFSGSTVSTDTTATDAALTDPDTVFISDSITPPVVGAAFTLYVTSPRRERTWEYNKTDGASMRYFPVLTWSEIDAMREVCFPHVADADAKERYTRWGGIPRYVLAQAAKERRVLESAIDGVQVRDLTVAFHEPSARSDDSTGSHRIFHVKVQGESDDALRTDDPLYYEFVSRDFASSYVAKELAKRGTALQRAEMVRLFNKSEGFRELAVARGHLFEALALERLSRGGRFPMRKLGAPASPQGGEFLELPPARRRTFHSLDSELPAEEQLEPASKSFSAIDVVLVGYRLANATSGKSHGIVLRGVRRKIGLEAVALRLGLRGVVRFYWIVPPSVYHAWSEPQVLLEGKTPLKPHEVASNEVGRRVEQYVVQVDVTSVSVPELEAPLESYATAGPRV